MYAFVEFMHFYATASSPLHKYKRSSFRQMPLIKLFLELTIPLSHFHFYQRIAYHDHDSFLTLLIYWTLELRKMGRTICFSKYRELLYNVTEEEVRAIKLHFYLNYSPITKIRLWSIYNILDIKNKQLLYWIFNFVYATACKWLANNKIVLVSD